ncbi:MAG: Flp family type IVb pilin [Bacillota bacterium]|nr:Flp family type IVb pilin [Bacillota bacterium]
MKELLGRLWKDESGQGMAEYGLILALIAVVVIAAALGLGTSIRDKFSGVAGEISATRP